MPSIYEDGFIIQPVLPKLRVLKLEGETELKQLAQLMRDAPHSFPGLPDTYKRDVAYRHNAVTAISQGKSGKQEVLAEKGHYLISSDNGYRHLTTITSIEQGLLDCIPQELFLPIDGQLL